MKRLMFGAAALTLAACAQSESPAQTAGAELPPQDLVLTCADFVSLTPDTLTRRFGAANISIETLFGPEGEPYEATVLFPNDVVRRLEIVWNDAGDAPVSISVDNPGTQWRAGPGYTIGTPLADIERINVMPFKLYGFGWDYGGWVSDWSVGTFAHSYVAGCSTGVRFAPRHDTTA